MSELSDTPDLSRLYCPGCEPDADLTREILRPYWCSKHEPSRDGELDRLVRGDEFNPLMGNAEADSRELNRSMCDLIHRPEETT